MTERLSFRDLTPEEVALVANGCGGKGSWVDPPDWLFKASCDWHDFEYWRGGTEADRKAADVGFYRAMVEDANGAPWWRRPFARCRAWVYYKAVRSFAEPYFYYGPQRNRDDLQELKRKAGLVD